MQLVVRTSDVRIKANILREEIETLILQNFEPLGFALRLLERLKGFEVGRPGIVERIFPILILFPRSGFTRGIGGRIGIAKGEVGRVVGHGMALGGNVEAHTGQAKVFVNHNLIGNILQGVLFMLGSQSTESFVQLHVRIERIVSRRSALLAVRIINRCIEFDLLGQELSGLHIGCHRIFVQIIVATLTNGFFQATKSFCFDMSAEIKGSHIGQLQIELRLRSPSSFIGKLLEAKFVSPHFDVLKGTGIVSHTNHNGANLAQTGITHNADFVGRTIGVVFCIQLRIACQAQ